MDTEELKSRASLCVVGAIGELNALRSSDAAVSVDEATVLLGETGVLDSLAFVNLAVALDGLVEREFGTTPGLVGELLGHADPSEFGTVELLTHFVVQRIKSVQP